MARRRGATRREAAVWTDALRRAAYSLVRDGPDAGMRRIDRIARTCVRLAEEGDLGAIREIGDRLEGRPLQRIEADGGAGLALGFAELLARVNAERRLKTVTVIDGTPA